MALYFGDKKISTLQNSSGRTLEGVKVYIDEQIALIDVDGQIDEHNTSADSHAIIRDSIQEIQDKLDSHTHTMEEISGLVFEVDTELSATSNNPVANSTINTKFDEISALIDLKSDEAIDVAQAYTNSIKDDILNGAGDAFDALKELNDLINNNQDAIDALESIASGKADKEHTHVVADIEDLQGVLDNKADLEHTHSYAGSSSVSGSATSAEKLDHSLTIQLNGGTLEGVDMFTFDGQVEQIVNITPENIGVAQYDHSHDDIYYTKTEVDGLLAQTTQVQIITWGVDD